MSKPTDGTVREWLDEAVSAIKEREVRARADAVESLEDWDAGYARGLEEARLEVLRVVAWHERVRSASDTGTTERT